MKQARRAVTRGFLVDRRAFIGTLAGGLLAAPLAVEAQPAGKVYRVGYVWIGAPGSESNTVDGLRQGLIIRS